MNVEKFEQRWTLLLKISSASEMHCHSIVIEQWKSFSSNIPLFENVIISYQLDFSLNEMGDLIEMVRMHDMLSTMVLNMDDCILLHKFFPSNSDKSVD
jgi:hypothetical protein